VVTPAIWMSMGRVLVIDRPAHLRYEGAEDLAGEPQGREQGAPPPSTLGAGHPVGGGRVA